LFDFDLFFFFFSWLERWHCRQPRPALWHCGWASGGVGGSALLSPFFRFSGLCPVRCANSRLFFIRVRFSARFFLVLGLSRCEFYF
jgi:hypothetical protein